jgi:hypothetical protein
VTIEQDPVEHSREETGGTSQVVRATSAPSRSTAIVASATQPLTSADITAELPAYRTTTPGAAGRSRYADPRPPGRARRRDPAPVLVRLVVWFLALVCAVAIAALVTVRVHPTWLSFLRNTHSSAASRTDRSATNTAAPAVAGSLAFVSQRGTTITYKVAVSSFSIVVNPISDAYVTVKSPPSATTYAFASVVTKGKPTPIAVHATAAVVLARQSVSIEVRSGNTLLGTIKKPPVGTTYILEASKG